MVGAATALTAISPAHAAAPPKPTGSPPRATGLAQVGVPRAQPPKPLPRKAGSVPVKAGQKARPVPPGHARRAAAAAALGDQTRLRALVLAVDADDFGVPTWKSMLDRVGASYDVLHTRTAALTPETLVAPDGTGRYNAILLTNSMLLYGEGGGFFTALNVEEWNRLWAYERDYGVRQAALYTSHGTWPENYCLTGSSEGGVGDTPLPVSLTAAGAQIFDYLKADAQIPVVQSYVYRTRIAAGCAAEAVLTAGDDVLGVRTTSPDGRERLALTFTSNEHLLHSHALVYGLFRWASRGLHLGEQRRFLTVDVDDWFNTADHYHEDGTIEYEPGYRVTGHDAYNLHQRQVALRAEHPTAPDFTVNLAYNGEDADPAGGNACAPDGGVDTLTATTRCLADEFRWVNHTLTHPELNFTDYATSRAEIENNAAAGASLGLDVPASVLKTGEYSGLGVYNDDPDNDTGPPTDHGLAASNPHLLQAAKDLGVRYLHGNMSFPSHVPSCFNCGITHPLEPAVTVVPDWPTNVAYFTTAPAEQTTFYNSFFGPGGLFPYWSRNLSYDEIIDYEAGLALNRLATGSAYTHTFHIANVRDYGGGNTLLTDWLDRVLDKYEALFAAPVLNPDWPALGAYADGRTAHFAGLAAGADAVYDRAAGTITVTSPQAGTVTVSGAQTAQSQAYGTEVSAPVALDAATPATVTAAPRS
ncbi:MAG TPA: hypothetical protein VES42_24260 [Pilimelia sp.]|nr:hypothetical protein [Pilimelia sp.]